MMGLGIPLDASKARTVHNAHTLLNADVTVEDTVKATSRVRRNADSASGGQDIH